MREINYTTQFERDFKRIKKNPNHKNVEGLLVGVITTLQRDGELAPRNQDHSLAGDYKECRECHIKPDLLLIYSKPTKMILTLIRLGSHSDLF
jgi:mRNA interferase YafQ